MYIYTSRSIVTFTSVREAPRSSGNLVIRKTSRLHPYGRMERQAPFHAILIRFIEVFKLPGRDAQAQTSLHARTDRLLARVPGRPACAVQFVRAVEDLVPSSQAP